MNEEQFSQISAGLSDLLLVVDRQQADLVIDAELIDDLRAALPQGTYAYIVFKQNPLEDTDLSDIMTQFLSQVNNDNSEMIKEQATLSAVTLAENADMSIQDLIDKLQELIP